jgi:hypothetical protein
MSIKNITYLDLIEACQKSGCLVCTLRDDMVESYIRMLFHEHVNDPPSRDKLRYSYGLCFQHSWLAIDAQLGNALGVAIISHDVVRKLLQDLSELPANDGRSNVLKKLLQASRRQSQRESWLMPKMDCPVCMHQDLVEERVLKTLVESIQKKELSDAIQHSDGLCLTHLRQSLVRSSSTESDDVLLNLARACWEKMEEELAEFIRKNDYRFSKEGFGVEKDSWLRATGILKGNRPKRRSLGT